MNCETEFQRLIGLLYDSVIDEAAWSCALQSLANFTGGTGIGEVIANPITGTITHCALLNVAPEFKDLYLGYYAPKEVRLAPAAKYGVGVVLTEGMLLDPRELHRSEIYNDMLRPFDVPHHMFAWLRKTETKIQTVAVEGSLKHGPFGPAAVARMNAVMPHLVRAVRMREHFVSLRDSQAAYREALETLPFGIVVLDELGQKLESTSLADKHFELGQTLTQRQRRVHARNHDDDRDLQEAIRRAIAPAPHAPVEASTVKIRRNRASPLKTTILPIGSESRISIVARPSALIVIVDPDNAPEPETVLLQVTLGLTRAEAGLAYVLFSGVSLREAAENLGRSVNTCKAQLKSIYAKTGCHTHVDLAKTLIMTALGERSSR